MKKGDKMKKRQYTMANLRADIAWFDERNVSDKTAVAFIIDLLTSYPTRAVVEFSKG